MLCLRVAVWPTVVPTGESFIYTEALSLKSVSLVERGFLPGRQAKHTRNGILRFSIAIYTSVFLIQSAILNDNATIVNVGLA